jgi:hypothetical protein
MMLGQFWLSMRTSFVAVTKPLRHIRWVNRVLLGTGSPLAIDHPGRRGRVHNRSGTLRVLRQIPSRHSNQ